MLNVRKSGRNCRQAQRGTTLLEVLVTILILTFGLLGLAGLQGQILVAELESFQRAQAVLLMNDMIDRINTNRSFAAAYVMTGTLGTGNTPATSCGSLATELLKDQCDWSKALLGASEVKGGGKVGGLVSGRGCVELVQAENSTAGICTPGVYRVTVAWQGSNMTSAPPVSCGQNLYGDERYRRAISSLVSIGLPAC